MFPSNFLYPLLLTLILALPRQLPAQATLAPLREIQLPVPSSRGSFGHFPIIGMSAREHFAMRVAPDQSVLTFDSDASGRWSLIRTRNWWTANPEHDQLAIPGWSVADAKYLDGIYVDIQVTPDGRYAVAFAEAVWNQKFDFLFHAPSSYLAKKPDTILTVIDLQHWQVFNSLHTVSNGGTRVRNARILGSGWIGLEEDIDSPPSDHGAYPHRDVLVSIPDLKPGPTCVIQRFSHIWRPAPKSLIASVQTQNEAACGELLRATGSTSIRTLETLIEKDRTEKPDALKLRDVKSLEDYLAKESHRALDDSERLWDAEAYADAFLHWGEYPYNHQFRENPPFQSSSHLWYGLYAVPDRDVYELGRYTATGVLEQAEQAPHLLCGDPSLGHSKSACSCRVVAVSEQQRTLLNYCRQQHGDYTGSVQHQWLSVFHADDLSAVAIIDLRKSSETLPAIASADGHPYILTLDLGEVLRVYALPVSP